LAVYLGAFLQCFQNFVYWSAGTYPGFDWHAVLTHKYKRILNDYLIFTNKFFICIEVYAQNDNILREEGEICPQIFIGGGTGTAPTCLKKEKDTFMFLKKLSKSGG
jgi:hypothetical protein